MARRDLPSKLQRAGLGCLLFVGAAGLGLAPAADGDLWWHLAAGREMVRTASLLTSDPFSASAGGRPWADVHWLFQLGAYGMYQLGGLTALVIAKALIVGASAWLFFAALGRKPGGRTPALFVTLLLGALWAARHLLLVRPVLLTVLFLAFFFRQLERFRREGDRRLLLPLPFLAVVWANFQGLFALGLVLIGAYAAGAALSTAFGGRRWFPFAAESTAPFPAKDHRYGLLVTLALCLLGSCVSPFGFRTVLLPLELLTRLFPHAHNVYAANVAENVPPFALERLGEGPFWHFKWYLAVLAVSFFLSFRRLLLSHLLVVTGFVGLALMSNRNVLLLYWMATPIAAMNLAPAARRAILSLGRDRGPMLARWLGRAALAGLVLMVGTAAARESNLGEPAPFRLPEESAAIIESRPGAGTIFAADHYGGYLIWRLYPRFRPYIDTRLILRSPQEFADYLHLLDEPERFDAFAQRQGFVYVVLPVAYPDRYLRLIAHLHAKKDWMLLFTDGAETLFARQSLVDRDDRSDLASAATTRRILDRADQRFAGSPRLRDEARMKLATLDIVVGSFGEAERILGPMASPEAQALRARSRLVSGDLEGAMEIGERLLEMDHGDVRSLDLLAMVYARRGELRRATQHLRRALAVDPFDGQATQLLMNMEQHQDEESRHDE